MFFSILLFSNEQAFRQNTFNSLNSLKLTLNSLKLSPLCSPLPAQLILNVIGPPKFDVTDPPVDPLHQSPKLTQAPSCRSTPQTNASDPPPIHTSDPSRPSLMLLTLSNSLSQTLTTKLSLLCPLAVAADPHLQPDSPSGELSLSSSSTCLGFFIWVIGMINL